MFREMRRKKQQLSEAEIRREWSGLSCFEIAVEHMTGKEGRELTLARHKQE